MKHANQQTQMAEERSAFEIDSEEPASFITGVAPEAEAADVIMHDPFSQEVVNNEYAFAQTLAVHQGAVRSLAF